MVFQFGAECATCDSQVAIVADWRDVSIRNNSDIRGKRRPVHSITSQFGANCATCDSQAAVFGGRDVTSQSNGGIH